MTQYRISLNVPKGMCVTPLSPDRCRKLKKEFEALGATKVVASGISVQFEAAADVAVKAREHMGTGWTLTPPAP